MEENQLNSWRQLDIMIEFDCIALRYTRYRPTLKWKECLK
jgi:hypothetical protein